MENEKSKMGRPTNYSDELADRICEVICTDSRAVGDLCEAIDWFPCKSIFYLWLTKHVHFSDIYSRAQIAQCAIRLEDGQQWIDRSDQDYCVDEKGRYVGNNVYAQRLRAHIHFNQWKASKLLAAMYGDKQADTIVNVISPELLQTAQKILADNNASTSGIREQTDSHQSTEHLKT